MKIFAAVLAACLVMSVYSQAAVDSTGAASTGSGSALPGLQRGLLGGNIMGLAAASGQLGDGMQRLMRCQMFGLPPLLCMNM